MQSYLQAIDEKVGYLCNKMKIKLLTIQKFV